MARLRILLVLAATALLVGVGASDAFAGKAKRGHAAKSQPPLSGIYDNCLMPDKAQTEPKSCAERLALQRQGGFRAVLNYSTDSMTVSDNLAYADLARANGMQVIWNLANYRVGTLEQKLELVRASASHPATWGYYIGDEQLAAELGQVQQVAAGVRGITNKPTLYVSRPNASKLRPFKRVADFVGPDSYPVGPIDPAVCPTARWASKMVKKPAGRFAPTSRKSRKSRKSSGGRSKQHFAMVLQAFSWSVDFPEVEHPWPTATEMRQMRNAATRCGQPELVLWFCFHCITDYHPDPETYWRDVAWAANGARVPDTLSFDG